MILSGKQLTLCVVLGVLLGTGMIATHTGPGLAADVANTPHSRNTVRQNDLNTLAQALAQYKTDHTAFPVKLPATDTPICTSAGQDCTSKHYADLSFLITGGDYLTAIPVDPGQAVGLWASGYNISQLPDGTIRLTAPQAEAGATISVVR
ncbi:MAG TPA: hypothetical protein VGH44_02240 [Candidatus Saccharimonadia bacterium]|jgi:hypothetical protein